MKKNYFILLFLSLLFICCQSGKGPETNFTQYVNPFVGTDFHGHTYPGALVPFGMVQVSPDTRLDGWDGCSAYHYSDSVVYGFSHTHLSGTGCSDYGDVLLMPFTGNQSSVINTEYASRFSHERETASPGYYSVILDKNEVKVELTASKRIGVHRYSFPESENKKGVILDLKHRDIVLSSSIQYDSSTHSIFGIRNSRAWNEDQKLSYSIVFSRPVEKIEYFRNDTLLAGASQISGKNCKAVIYFGKETKDVVLKVAISANTEEENAAAKNHVEIGDFDFDRVREEADMAWNKELGKIVAEGKNTEQKKVFYTALYHAFTAPYLFTDVDGTYLGQDGKIHQAEDHDVYTVFSLWDTYRALHPLLSLIDRERTGDFLYTFMKHYEQGGMLTVWELSAFETWCMIGYHSVPVIYDAYVKNIVNYEPEKMLEAMVTSARLNKLGRPEFARYGYIPADMEHEDVSKTLEYAYDDWCIAQFAKATGNDTVAGEFFERCQYYKNILDPDGFMRSKINGSFITPFDPTEINNHFTEGNSWQYSTYVPHDIATYISLLGGPSVAEAHFDSLFHTSSVMGGRDQVDVTGLVGQYAHGNEPSHHAAYFYNYIGKPWKTQQMVRKIMSELYTSEPDGLCGNEDCGQMSAWYVFSAMGFYPVCPGDNQYIIGSPVFDKVTINLENGKQFTVRCDKQGDKNIYIQSAKLNGKTYTKSFITYDDIKDGGILELVMGKNPNTQWGSSPDDIPFSQVGHSITQVPVLNLSNKTFKGETEIAISLYEPNRKDDPNKQYPAQTDAIYYTLDGSRPDLNSLQYQKPFVIRDDTKINAVAYNPVTGFSKVVEAEFLKYEKDKNIAIFSRYSPLYTAGGDEGLIDNVRGKKNFSLGGWQGYQGQDFQAVVDLGAVKSIQQLGAGFLQNIRSWIWFPTSVTFEVSEDNEHYKHYGTFINPHPVDDYTEMIDDFMITRPAKARFVKITAKNFGKLPEWHLGAGGEAYIFIDEILIK